MSVSSSWRLSQFSGRFTINVINSCLCVDNNNKAEIETTFNSHYLLFKAYTNWSNFNMAGQDQKNSNQNGISDDNEIEPVDQTDDEAVAEGIIVAKIYWNTILCAGINYSSYLKN